MIVQVPEPAIDEPTIDDWRKLVGKMGAQTRGFIMLGMSEILTNLEPKILKGSRFELDGKLYLCNANESIDFTNESFTETNYIYAEKTGENVIFKSYTLVPSWDGERCGWYYDARRAVAKMGAFSPKIILDCFSVFYFTEYPMVSYQ